MNQLFLYLGSTSTLNKGKPKINKDTPPFIFVCRTADNSALSRSLDSAEIYISYSVHKCEWHSTNLRDYKYF